MKKALYIVLLAFASLTVKGYSFKLTVPDLPMALNYLMLSYGHQKLPIDTLITNDKGELEFNFSNEAKPGLYRIQFSTKYYLDFIYNNEDIEIRTLKSNWKDSLKVIKSQETQAYYIAKNANATFLWKMKQLDVMLDTTSKTNPYYQMVTNEYNKLQNQQKNIVEKLQESFPSYLITKMTEVQARPYISPSLNSKEREQFVKSNFFNKVSFKDTALLYTDSYTYKVYDFLQLFVDANLFQNKQEELFIKAVDMVMPIAYAGNPIIFDQVVNFLIDHFSRLRFDIVLNHILETYVDEHSCENYEVKSNYEARINKFLKVKVGDKAPPFSVKGINGDKITLKSSKAKFTLLVFWASWCPHCADELPKIKEIYDNANKQQLDVIAFSLDTKENDLKEFVKNGDYTWHSCSDFKSWDSPIVEAYNVYGTPTIFLIDQNKTIVAKPSNLSYLKSDLKKYLQP